mmetsp:Transcript_23547/g.50838  ORF Transcript_23547/g.50838 Transcript_23547/m.50838 type:complete len:307 (+) Transcript_23547:332-1252(+)
MTENENDVAWREYNIHDDYNKTTTSDNNQSQEEDNNDEQQQPVDIFATQEDPYDVQEYTFPDKNHGDDDNNGKTQITIILREQKDYDVSTGMSVWKGSEILCQYLIEHPHVIRGKKVLEVGAGVGLCGVVSAKVLGASSVLLTDGDQLVLGNLRHNMELNELLGSSSTTTTTTTTTTTNNESSSSCPCSCSCPQLIWGKSRAITFEKEYGKQDVILATDCVYVTKSVRPLFETVSQLLVSKKNNNNGNNDDGGGIFLFVNSCASICPLEEVMRIGKEFGFAASEEEMWYQQPGDESDPVYVFRRRC